MINLAEPLRGGALSFSFTKSPFPAYSWLFPNVFSTDLFLLQDDSARLFRQRAMRICRPFFFQRYSAFCPWS